MSKSRKKRALLVIGAITVCVVAVGSFSKIATKHLQSVLNEAPDPFLLNAGESVYHITSDFQLVDTVAFGEKSYAVTYELPKEFTIEKSGETYLVGIPDVGTNQTITIVQKAKSFLAKAERSFPVRVVTKNAYDYENYSPIQISDVANDNTIGAMEVCLSKDGQIDYMYGDFDGAKVNNDTDALHFIEKYLSVLNFPGEVSLENSVFAEGVSKYAFVGKVNGVEVPLNTIDLTVDSNSNPVKISCSVRERQLPQTEARTVDKELYMPALASYLGTDQFFYTYCDTVVYEGRYKDILEFTTAEGFSAYAVVDQIDNSIALVSSLIDNAASDTDSTHIYYSGDGFEKYEAAKVNGVTEDGTKVTLDASKNKDGYVLFDGSRKIYVYEKGEGKYQTGLYGYLDKEAYRKISVNNGGAYYPVRSESDTFPESAAVQIETLKYLADAYDFFQNVLGHKSYDGKGSVITAFTGISNQTFFGMDMGGYYNNACFQKLDNCFYIGKKTDHYAYNIINRPVVLAHEYAHGVQNTICNATGWNALLNSEVNVSGGISEGYADVLGMLACKEKDDWKFAKNVANTGIQIRLADGNTTVLEKETPFYDRNLKDIKSDGFSNKLSKKEFFLYDDPNFATIEIHRQGLLLGNLCYQMYNSDLFTNDEIAKIWYDALYYGLNASSTFVTVRRNLLQAMEQLGYDAEHRDFVAYACDNLHIYDPNYEITTPKYIGVQTDLESSDTILKSGTPKIAGDPLYDDAVVCKFVVMYSMADMTLGGANLTIYECSERDTGLSDKEMSKLIEEKLNTKSHLKEKVDANTNSLGGFLDFFGSYTGSDMPSVTEKSITVQYEKISKSRMEKVEKTLDSGKGILKDFAGSILEDTGNGDIVDTDIFNGIFENAVTSYVTEETAYNFFTGL